MYPDDNGDMVYGGIDVSVAQYIADYTGKTLQTENMAFDYLLASLQKGDFDIVIAAMEATDERKEAADFSDPYYTDYPPMILVKKENADQYKTLADFDGKAVGAQTGTTKADIVTNDMPGANLVALQLVTDLVNQLMYDKVDAVVVDRQRRQPVCRRERRFRHRRGVQRAWRGGTLLRRRSEGRPEGPAPRHQRSHCQDQFREQDRRVHLSGRFPERRGRGSLRRRACGIIPYTVIPFSCKVQGRLPALHFAHVRRLIEK